MNRVYKALLTLIVTASLAAGCNFPTQLATATPGPSTIAVRTVEGILTLAAITTQPSLPITIPPSPSNTATGTTATPSDTECVDRATFVADVTFPDDTVVQPGEPILKIWSLQNSGTCSWTQDYALTFFGGERMGAISVSALRSNVLPGETVDLAVDMTAPTQPGTYQGFWRLRNADGNFFGIGPSGNQSFWVKIIVPAPPTSTLTPTISPTPTLTPTPSSTSTELPSNTPTETSTPAPTETNTATDTPTG